MSISTEPITLENLPEEIRREILDPEFANRRHYSRATSAKGCHGPLCRLAERESRARRYRERKANQGEGVKEYDLGEERRAEEAYLHRVIAWYYMWNNDRKLQESA